MGSILKNTMHDLQPGLIVVYYCIVFFIVRFSYGDRVCRLAFVSYGRCRWSLSCT